MQHSDTHLWRHLWMCSYGETWFFFFLPINGFCLTGEKYVINKRVFFICTFHQKNSWQKPPSKQSRNEEEEDDTVQVLHRRVWWKIWDVISWLFFFLFRYHGLLYLSSSRSKISHFLKTGSSPLEGKWSVAQETTLHFVTKEQNKKTNKLWLVWSLV